MMQRFDRLAGEIKKIKEWIVSLAESLDDIKDQIDNLMARIDTGRIMISPAALVFVRYLSNRDTAWHWYGD